MLAQLADLRLCALMSLRPFVCALMSGFGNPIRIKCPSSTALQVMEARRQRLFFIKTQIALKQKRFKKLKLVQ